MMRTDGTVYLVDDDPDVRLALSELIATFGFPVVSFGTAQEFLRYQRSDTAACLVLDLHLPDMGGHDLQRQLAEDGPPIIFISSCGEVSDSVRAMKAGALEFLEKPVDIVALIATIEAALARDLQSRSRRAELAELQTRLARLSPRERQVLPLVIGGRRNQQAANELGIANVTMQVHRGRIMHKMAVRSLADLVRIGERLGIPLPDAMNEAHG